MKLDPIVLDMIAAFGAAPFDWNSGDFYICREHEAGSFGHPDKYLWTWRVPARRAVLNALVEKGLVEVLPRWANYGYRLSLSALALLPDENAIQRTEQPSWKLWSDVHRRRMQEHNAR